MCWTRLGGKASFGCLNWLVGRKAGVLVGLLVVTSLGLLQDHVVVCQGLWSEFKLILC